MKVVIAGSRSITSYGVVDRAIRQACAEHNITITEVIEGEAPGVDVLAKAWATTNGIPYDPMPADWKNIDAPGAVVRKGKWGPYNAVAGFWRNEEMAKKGEALIAVWDGESGGTKDMINRARAHGLIVAVINTSQW
jgi:hypothetical protein